MNKNVGVISMGVKAPIIREGDDLKSIVVNSVLDATDIDDKDIISITESVVARSQGNYITVDEIAEDVRKRLGNESTIALINPIYSRNRFSMILKGIARAAKRVVIYMPDVDEVGNVVRNHPFTGMNYDEYYESIVNSEGATCLICHKIFDFDDFDDSPCLIYCGLHDYNEWRYKNGSATCITLADICSDKCEFGVLGSNKATEEKLKLFPKKDKATDLCYAIKEQIKNKTGKDVYVCVYGDGCFHSPKVNGIDGTSINEFADPVTMPAYTDSNIFESSPNEIKIKAFADDKYKNLSGNDLELAIKEEIKSKNKNLVGNMSSQGTTPRMIRDLVASLCDLTTGSGDKGCPIVVVKNYFKNYSD